MSNWKKDREAYKQNIAAVVESGDYMRLSSALRYVDKVLRDPWESLVGPSDEEPSARFSMAETDILIVHLFGAGVLRHGTKTLKRKAIVNFAAFTEPFSEVERRGFRAISQNDIARCIGKSRSAVERSIARMRKCQWLSRVCFPLFVPSGIMMDVAITRQFAFSFEVDDYTVARAASENARLASAPTYRAQQEHCSEAIRTKFTASMPQAEKVADNDRAEDVAV